jgi:replicative DNA helicase
MNEEHENTLTPPFAHDAEAAMICCVVENPKRFASRASESQITRDFFHKPAHSSLWSLLFSRITNGKSVDPISVREAIKDERPENLSVSDLSDVLLSQYDEKAWHGYIETLRDRYARRLAINTGAQVASDNADGQSAVAMLRKAAEMASAALAGSSAVLDSKRAVAAFIAAFEERHTNGEMPGMSTGISQLDELTGGLRRGELWVIGAKTSVGKSVMMLQIAASAIKAGKRVAIFSLEMGVEEVIGRMVSCENRINIGHILNPRKMAKADMLKIKKAVEDFQDTGMMVCDAGDMTIDAISGHCQRLSDEGGLDLVVIDYLQMIASPRIKGQNREQEVACISRACKQLAKRIKCPVITATQLNEAGQARESRAIEQDADAVFLITPKKDDEGCIIQAWKCRNGKRGVEFPAVMDGEYQKFRFF